MKGSLTKKTRYEGWTCTIINGAMQLREGVVYEPQRLFQDAGYDRGCSILIAATAFAKETKYQIFTPADLLYFDGGNGRPAYVVAEGIV